MKPFVYRFAVASFVVLPACDLGATSVTSTAGEAAADDLSDATSSPSSSSTSGTDAESAEPKTTGSESTEAATTGPESTEAATTEAESAYEDCPRTITILAGPDNVGPLGIPPSQILEVNLGEYHGTLTWNGEGFPTEPIPFTLTITYEGGELRDIDVERPPICHEDFACSCTDKLELDVVIRLTSDDGRLNERWEVVLAHGPVAYEVGEVLETRIRYSFDPALANGSLSQHSFEADPNDDEIVLNLALQGRAFEGRISTERTGPGWMSSSLLAAMGAVTTLEACSTLSSSGCTLAGCTLVAGREVFHLDTQSCSCYDPVLYGYCFAGPLEGEPVPTRYVRSGLIDEVVVFDTPLDPVPAPWRACSDAPEISACTCSGVDGCPPN